MLSHEDRRRLEAIAQDLECEDPKLARRLRTQPGARRWQTRTLQIALLVLGVLGLLFGLLVGDLTIFLITGLVPLGVAVWLRRGPQPGPS